MVRQTRLICRTIAVQPWEVIPCLSENGQGKEKLLDRIERILTPESETAEEE